MPSRSRRTAPSFNSSRSSCHCRAAGSAANASSPIVSLAGGAVTDGDIARVLRAANTPFRARRPCGAAFAADRLRARRRDRHPRAARHARPPFRRRHAHGDGRRRHRAQFDAQRSSAATSHVEAMVSSPYAAGLAVLADDEADLGAASSISAPARRQLRCFPAGASCMPTDLRSAARHVTMDLARGLNTRIADAERIKAIYGSVLSGGSDERDMITVPPVGDDEREPPQFVSRATLDAHHQAARRRDSGNGARSSGRFAVRGRAARAHRSHRRRQPTRRHCGSWPRAF